MDFPVFTSFAEVYSHPHGDRHRVLAGVVPYKSGLTPIDLPNPSTTPAERAQMRGWEMYQLVRLKGFLADDLDALETLAMTNDSSDDTTLEDVPIHPAFDKPRWMLPLPNHWAQYPLGLGRAGYWHVENDVVWDAMQPALRLASKILQNSHTWPWFEAFIDPRCYEVIDDYELPLEFSNRCYKRFRVRPPHIAAKDRDSMHQKLILLSTKIQFNLGTGSHESKNDDSYSDGVTTLATTGWQRTICNLSYQLLEPLLSPTNQKITPAERMLCHFNIAIALLHEFAHALWDNMWRTEHPRMKGKEPYFEDEGMAEVGYSMEVGVFGGSNTAFKNPSRGEPRGLPLAGIFSSSPFCWVWKDVGATHQPYFTENNPKWDEETFFPIPISYFVNLFHPTFWQAYVKRNGHKSTLMGPKTIGVKYLRDPIDDSLNISGFVSHPDQQDALIVAISDNMTDDEKISTMVENLRRTTAQGVVRAFMDKTDRRNAAEELLSRQSHHGPINHQGSNGQPELESPTQTNSVSPLQTYRYPQFDPGCSAEDYGMIRDFLFANRQQLALESGCFDIPEHLMLAYINRLGHDLQPNIWRGFLLSCGKKGELFSYREIGVAPTSTTLAISRVDNGWPINCLPARNLWSQVPADYKIGTWPILRAFDFATFKMLERYSSMFYELCDLDKDCFLLFLNKTWDKYAPQNGRFNMQELDACIDYYEMKDQKWLFGPPGIIRKSEKGWDDSSDASSSISQADSS